MFPAHHAIRGPSAGLALAVAALAGCAGTHGLHVSAHRYEPVMRVRVVAGADALTVGATGSIRVDSPDGRARPHDFAAPITINRLGRSFTISAPGRNPVRWKIPALRLNGDGLSIDGRTYPETLVVTESDGGGLDAVNHLPLETYLPGVLAGELYADWEPAAFEAQAVAARSYALWERSRYPQRSYDIEATTASQVYEGAAANPRALTAVHRSRGRVLVFDQLIVPAFYCSATGNRSQDAVAAFPDRAPDIEPLRGGLRGGWDHASPHHRWGPVHRERRTLARRIAAWGWAHHDSVRHLEQITRIEVTATNDFGRPTSIAVYDGARGFELGAEEFRFACNFNGERLPPLRPDEALRSSDLSVAMDEGSIVFQGRGFGHGVGLSQWGAQAMAQRGRNADSILRFYYPGAEIRKLY